jgi:hypothetical protein
MVGQAAMTIAVSGDDEVAGINYVVTNAPKPTATAEVRRAWRSASRRNDPQRRLIKFLLGRLTANRDPVAIRWCLARLGDLDYLAPTVGRYLSRFASRPTVQAGVVQFLASDENISEWQEMNLYRALLSAKRLGRPLLDRARSVADDLNAGVEVRQFAVLLLGHFGDGGDHAFIGRVAIDQEPLAEALLLALHDASRPLRGRVYTQIAARHPNLDPLIRKIRGQVTPAWPRFG